jgi:hypothetical protein
VLSTVLLYRQSVGVLGEGYSFALQAQNLKLYFIQRLAIALKINGYE